MHNRDIIFHIGPRKCGKSEFVEKELSTINHKLYVGTLPSDNHFQNTILLHRNRRGCDWHTIELNNNFEHDLQYLTLTLKDFPEDGACMLDGIWAWYYFANLKEPSLNSQYFADKISEIIEASCLEWRLVDVFYTNSELHSNKVIELIHHRIINNLNNITIIDWNYERF